MLISGLDGYTKKIFNITHISGVYSSIAHGLYDCSVSVTGNGSSGSSGAGGSSGGGINILTWCMEHLSGSPGGTKTLEAIGETTHSLCLHLIHNIFLAHPACLDGFKQDSVVYCHTHGIDTHINHINIKVLGALPYTRILEGLICNICDSIIHSCVGLGLGTTTTIITGTTTITGDVSVVTAGLTVLTYILQYLTVGVINNTNSPDYSTNIIAHIHTYILTNIFIDKYASRVQFITVIKALLRGRHSCPRRHAQCPSVGLSYGYWSPVGSIDAVIEYVSTVTYIIQSTYYTPIIDTDTGTGSRGRGGGRAVDADVDTWLVNQLPLSNTNTTNTTRRSTLVPIYLSHKTSHSSHNSSHSLSIFPHLCSLIQDAGSGSSSGELSSLGLMAAMYYIRTYIQYMAGEAVELSLPGMVMWLCVCIVCIVCIVCRWVCIHG